LNTIASLWKEFGDRSGWFEEDVVVDDIFKAMEYKLGWSKNIIKIWLHTPPALGGFGLYPQCSLMRFKVKTNVLRKKQGNSRFPDFPFSSIDIKAVRYNSIKERFRINTENQKIPSLYSLLNRHPTWLEYIQYQELCFLFLTR